MRAFVFCLALLAPANAHAADAVAAPETAAATTASTPAASSATAAGLTLDTPIADIAAAPAGKAVLDKQLPGLLTHPAYEAFKGFSLKALQPYSNGLITDERLAAVDTDLKSLNPTG